MYSIIIPTFNNIAYLKKCIESIKKNSKFEHEIIPHVNEGSDGTIEFLEQENIKFTHTKYNSGICTGMNMAAKESKYDYILYAHDDFYFCPKWDLVLEKEISKISHNRFYLSGTMVNNGQIDLNCGNDLESFDESKLLKEIDNANYYDFQGSTWAPHLIHKEMWNKVGGFSEEFFPGAGSDPDFNLKLWNIGVRTFKCLSTSKIYHFKSKTLRRKITSIGSKSGKLFIKKWGFSIKFFKKHYLESGKVYTNELSGPNKNLRFFFDLFLCKINYFYLKLFNRT